MTECNHMPTTNDPISWQSALSVGFAMLGPAAAWVVHLNLTYFLVQPACLMGGETLLHLGGGLTLLVALAALVNSSLLLSRHRTPFRRSVEGFNGWKAFVGLFGIASAIIFALAIIAQWSTVFVIDACTG